jgi:methylmalonyl-CoA mutase N-terminal domain/subunit
MHPYREEETGRQIERLRRVRRERSGEAVRACLARVRAAADNGENVMPPVMDAVEAYATVGEVCEALRQVFGNYREPVRF